MNTPGRSGPLVLASGSPRRRALLEAAGYRFRVRPVEGVEIGADEDRQGGTKPRMVVEENARRKAVAGQALLRSVAPDEATEDAGGPEGSEGAKTYVLAADTLLLVENDWVGKPRDREEAAALLGRLAGKAHEVATGVALVGPDVDVSFVEVTLVVLKPLTMAEIRAYHRAVDPLDKAGGYDIDQPGPIPGGIVSSINGSYSNVMGLPMERLGPILDRVLAS